MAKKIIIASLAFSLTLFIFFIATGNETVLAAILLGLLVCFISSMVQLSKK